MIDFSEGTVIFFVSALRTLGCHLVHALKEKDRDASFHISRNETPRASEIENTFGSLHFQAQGLFTNCREEQFDTLCPFSFSSPLSVSLFLFSPCLHACRDKRGIRAIKMIAFFPLEIAKFPGVGFSFSSSALVFCRGFTEYTRNCWRLKSNNSSKDKYQADFHFSSVSFAFATICNVLQLRSLEPNLIKRMIDARLNGLVC